VTIFKNCDLKVDLDSDAFIALNISSIYMFPPAARILGFSFPTSVLK
jgi:hypothetical protein